MKKTLIAAAALAVAGAASAQVTLSGAIGFGWQNSFGAGGATVRSDGNVNVTAKEDLGGGMSVTAVGGVDLQHRGQYAAGRNLSLSLAGGFGTLSASSVNGAYWSRLSGAGGTISLDKDLDDIYGGDVNIQSWSYKTPDLVKGLNVTLGWSGAPGAALSDTAAATAPGGIGSDSLDVAVNYAFSGGSAYLTYRPDDSRIRVGGAVSAGPATVGLHYIPGFTSGASTFGATTEAEVWVPMGAVTVGAQMAQRSASTGLAKRSGHSLGVKYALSGRTSVIASFADVDDGSGRADTSQSRIKLVHSF